MRRTDATENGRGKIRCCAERLEPRACLAAVSIGSVALPEGTNASPVAKFVVTLSEKVSKPVIVNWATSDGTATVADNDYRAASGTVVFAPGQTSRTIGVYVCGDSKVEPNEGFSVSLTDARGATLGNATATATIVNDDPTPVQLPSLSVGDVQVTERNGGRSDARFTVSLSQPSDRPVTVRCATVDGTATASDADYIAMSRALTFAPRETSKVVTVSVLGDTRIEPDETFGLVLSAASGATIDKATGIATIRNDDFTPPSRLVASVSEGGTVEGNGSPDPQNMVAFTITLSRTPESVVTVGYRTVDGTATIADNDYVSTSGVVQFAVGETSKTIVVPVVGDTKPERNETFSVALVSAEGAVPNRAPATGTIVDDDTPPELRVAGTSLLEGDTGTSAASFVLTLSSAWNKPVVVTYATRDGSATVADSDYVAAQGTVTFDPGQTQKTVEVSVVGDTRPETDERFYLDISSATNATVAGATGTAIIRNDDSGEVPGFQITVAYSGTVRQSIQEACDWAAQRWSQVITGDLPGVTDAQGVFVDDLRIVVKEGLIGGGDGPGGALANAGPDDFRDGTAGLPWSASAGIDPYDAGDSQLRNIVLHEFGHALGFGISGRGLPNFYSRFVVGDGFTGSNALREYRSRFGDKGTSVPLETGGGQGTAGAHWRESVLKTELMTGYSEAPGVTMPLSAITVGAMQDMGYTVNYAAADSYTAPAGLIAATVQAGGVGGSQLAGPSVSRSSHRSTGTGVRGRALAMESVSPHAPSAAAPQSDAIGRVAARTPRDRLFAAYVGLRPQGSEKGPRVPGFVLDPGCIAKAR